MHDPAAAAATASAAAVAAAGCRPRRRCTPAALDSCCSPPCCQTPPPAPDVLQRLLQPFLAVSSRKQAAFSTAAETPHLMPEMRIPLQPLLLLPPMSSGMSAKIPGVGASFPLMQAAVPNPTAVATGLPPRLPPELQHAAAAAGVPPTESKRCPLHVPLRLPPLCRGRIP